MSHKRLGASKTDKGLLATCLPHKCVHVLHHHELHIPGVSLTGPSGIRRANNLVTDPPRRPVSYFRLRALSGDTGRRFLRVVRGGVEALAWASSSISAAVLTPRVAVAGGVSRLGPSRDCRLRSCPRHYQSHRHPPRQPRPPQRLPRLPSAQPCHPRPQKRAISQAPRPHRRPPIPTDQSPSSPPTYRLPPQLPLPSHPPHRTTPLPPV